MTRITLDCETYSDLDLKEVGAHRYAEDFSTEVLCVVYAFDDGGSYLWLPGDHVPDFPAGFVIDAHNAAFERAIWENILAPLYGWPEIEPHQWDCTMARAASRALPLGLDGAGAALDLPVQKDKEGRRLIRLLCQPQKPTKKQPKRRPTPEDRPEDFAALYCYCAQDVAAEVSLRERLGPLPAAERKVWLLDQKINNRGVAVDMEAVRAAIEVVSCVEARLTQELVALTGIDSHNKVAKLGEWLTANGCPAPDLTADTVEGLLKSKRFDGTVGRVLELRSILAKASTAKLKRFAGCVGSDGRVRGMFQYHGAFTGRWAGRLVQPQNMPRPSDENTDWDWLIAAIKTRDADFLDMTYGDAMLAVADALRPMLVAGPGKRFVAGDLSAIEAVGLACLAGEERKIDVFRRGEDPYCFAATNVFGYKVIDKKTHPKERQVGKVCELAFGYGGGVGAWRNFDSSDAHTDEQVEGYRDAWRAAHPRIRDLWRGLETAAIRAVADGCGKKYEYRDVAYKTQDEWLVCRLRSGRSICYHRPELEEYEDAYGREQVRLTYMSQKDGQWKRVSTWGGKLTENVDQAECRDVLVHGMFLAEAVGLPIVMTSHDEIVTEVPDDQSDAEALLHAAMTTNPAWASDWPLKAETWTGRRYRK